MPGSPGDPSFFPAVPLFPLPGVVLFPHAVLPLHIFEERYKAMTADAVASDKLIAMALLRPGWEKNYYGRPEIEPVVCVGEILTHESLDDGKYNFLLRGVARATIIREHTAAPYRVADLQLLPECSIDESQLQRHRRRIVELLSVDLAALLPGAPQFLQMLSTAVPTSVVADLIAFHILDDVPSKQMLLSDGDVDRRVSFIVDALSRLRPPSKPLRLDAPQDPSWN